MVLCLTLIAGSSLGVSHAQPAEQTLNPRICTVAEIEQMLNQGIGSCAGSFAPYSGEGGSASDAQVDGDLLPLAVSCPYTTHGDWVHLSGGDVSGHGWWETNSYSLCPTYADVEVTIQGWWCSWICDWVTVAHNEMRIRPKNIYNERTTARRFCVGTDIVGFRSVIDVDLVGVGDPADKFYTQWRDLACRPS